MMQVEVAYGLISTAMSQIHDELFDALANEQRRRILFDLVARYPTEEPPVYIDAPPDAFGDRSAADVERYHVHLPKLDEHGFIDWNRDTNTVEPGDRFADVRPIVEQLYDLQAESPLELV